MNLPQYSIKISTRARHVRFRVTPSDGLCVVIPAGFDPAEIPALVAKSQTWIEQALEDVADRLSPITPDYLPEKLLLPAIDEVWTVDYRLSGKRPSLDVADGEHQLVFSTPEHNQATVFNGLRNWLRQRARETFTEQAYALAQELGFTINNVTIRNQRTRWGSCSSKKNLSLNLKLLFLEPQQVRHVLLHELCHTVYLDHSPNFWQLVASFEPGYKVIRKSMKNAWQAVPRWV